MYALHIHITHLKTTLLLLQYIQCFLILCNQQNGSISYTYNGSISYTYKMLPSPIKTEF